MMIGPVKAWARVHGLRVSRIRRMPASHYSNGKVPGKFFSENRPKQTMSLQAKISTYLMNIIKQESSNIVHSLTDDSRLHHNKIDDFLEKNPVLAAKLNESMDTYNRLFRLLSYNPIDIPPELYIHYYEMSEIPLDPDLHKLLIQRLLFHKQYQYFWKICLENNVSLTDLDDFIDLVFKVLRDSKDQTYGISELLLHFPEETISERLGHHIMDTICFKFHMNRSHLVAETSSWNDIRQLSTPEDFNTFFDSKKELLKTSVVMQSLFLKRLFQVWTEDMEMVKSRFIQFIDQSQSSIFQTPGWVTMVSPLRVTCMQPMEDHVPLSASPNISAFRDFVDSSISETTRLNEVDIACIYHLHADVDHYSIYKCYSNATPDPEASTPKNTSIMNFLIREILQCVPYEVLSEMLSNNFKYLDYTNISKGLLRIFQEDQSEFEVLLDRLNHVKQKNDITSILQKLSDMILKMDEVTIKDYHNYSCALIKYDRTKRGIRYFLKNLNLSQSQMILYHTDLIYSPRIQSCNALLEINRSIVRNKLLAEHLIAPLYEKVLRVVLNRQFMNDNVLEKDFLSIKDLIGPKRIAQFHNSLRAMGQTYSILDAKDIASVLDIVSEVTLSDRFSVSKNLSTQLYILDCVTDEIMRFIDRSSDGSQSSIFKYRDIMSNMKSSQTRVAAWLFRIMVKEDTTKAIKLLHHYKDSKKTLAGSLKHIISGILSSDLEPNKKITTLMMFFDTMKSLGYKHRLRASNAVELSKIIALNKEKLTSSSLDSINKFSQHHRSVRKALSHSTNIE